jgi:hypothetical protein
VKPTVDEKTFNDAAEAAIARVLASERECRAAIEQARLEVGRIDENARRADHAIAARTERRIRTVVRAFEREIAERLAEIEAAAAPVAGPQSLRPSETGALQRAVRALARELIETPP